jgi:fructosamine-3-kinase
LKLPISVEQAVKTALGTAPSHLEPLSGGCVGEVYGLRAGNADYVIKLDRAGSDTLAIEGRMLAYLAGHTALPAPRPVAFDRHFLLMTRLESGGGLDRQVEIHAADLLAALHGIGSGRYGFEFDTVIGGLPQPNPWHSDWHAFFARHRLVEMARLAHDAGQLPAALLACVETLAGRIHDFLGPAQPPGLIHGDVWSGNVLAAHGRISGFIDPAIHFADPEIELAFITLFSTFGEGFFARYREHRPISADFWDIRRPLYNLYPLLVHARLFGGHYVSSVAATLDKFA